MKSKTALLLSLIFPFISRAEGGFFAELMRTSDKMFVVVIVLLIIFFGIIFFLTLLEKRVKRLEKEVDRL